MSRPPKTLRWLRLTLLVGVAVALATVASDYLTSRQADSERPLAEPAVIPLDLNSQANRYTWTQTVGDRRSVEGSAASFRQARSTLGLELSGVELKIFHDTLARPVGSASC